MIGLRLGGLRVSLNMGRRVFIRMQVVGLGAFIDGCVHDVHDLVIGV